MKLIYETPEIELNKYKFSDVLGAGYSSAVSGEHGYIPEQDATDQLGSEQDTWTEDDDDPW